MNLRSSQTIKLLLIPVLGFVLFSVVFEDEGFNEQQSLAPRKSNSQASKQDKPSSNSKQALTVLPPWPSCCLDDMLAHNPFHIPKPPPVEPDSTTEPDEDESAPVTPSATTLQTLRVTAVVSGQNGMMALVNNRMVQVGDTLDNGLVVVGIDENAITVKPNTP
ncbi:hypothetical protein [Thalassoroseus pseudoceratinae]|uniref:hypothetical protein n=1 Tax=Thalassoroseus pseudoceratinae TaxID=2713176 RepID=UPI00141E5689|nr:hypothetical protein [Thalassoroseus pseudoceratinae]